jgi:hypothetical protein
VDDKDGLKIWKKSANMSNNDSENVNKLAVLHLRFLREANISGPEYLSQYSDRLGTGRPEFDSKLGPDFSFRHHVQIGSGTHTESYLTDTAAFPREQGGRDVKLTTHFHLVPRLRMRGTAISLPHTSSWCGGWLSTGYVFMA